MTYLLKIKNDNKAKALIQFLNSIDYVEVKEQDNYSEWKEIVHEAEKTKSIPLSKALAESGQWKNK
ncbi:MAG: hypothetical protein ABIT08_01485 [Bacteroidia bacterium]